MNQSDERIAPKRVRVLLTELFGPTEIADDPITIEAEVLQKGLAGLGFPPVSTGTDEGDLGNALGLLQEAGRRGLGWARASQPAPICSCAAVGPGRAWWIMRAARQPPRL